MNRRFWKWAVTFVASTWFGGLGLLALDIVPTVWVAYVTLPGMLAGSVVPALWMGDPPIKVRKRNVKKAAL